MEYADQSNNPDDLFRHHFNLSQVRQQERLSGGSWSQPPWAGWRPIIGAGRGEDAFTSMPDHFYQRYAQDGDSGFHHGLRGGSEPLGMNPIPSNPFHPSGEISHPTQAYAEPALRVISPEIVQPSPTPIGLDEEREVAIHAEPQQRAVYAPPYSQTLKQGMGKIPEDSSLYEEPFEYKGTLHKKKSLRK